MRPTRVCPRCGMGLLLSAASDVAPTREDPFLVIDGALTIRAVSERAEELLGLAETEAVNEHVLNYLAPAEAEGAGPENLVSLLARAASGETAAHDVVIRPRATSSACACGRASAHAGRLPRRCWSSRPHADSGDGGRPVALARWSPSHARNAPKCRMCCGRCSSRPKAR